MEAEIEKSETSLVMKRTFRASAARLFQAWTDPPFMDRWFHPDARIRSECTVDLHVGGRYEVKMHASGDQLYVVSGVYEEIIPGERLVFTWRWLDAELPDEMLVTVDLRPIADKETELILRHERFPSVEERDSHAQGWEGTLAQLEAVLS